MPAFLTAFLYALVVSALLVPVCRVLARRVGAVARPRNDRWHRDVIPLLGGVAIALAFLVGAIATGVARNLAVPFGTALIMFVVGLVDDLISLRPATKLIAQIVLAATLVYFGYGLHWMDSRLLNSLLTIIWVVGLTNAFNLLDNMDGLCAGIAVIVGAMLIAGLYFGVTREAAADEMAFLALLVGAAGGFLLYNFPPASIFMGDSGALMLGFSLAALTLSPEGVRGSRTDVISTIAGPMFVLLVPIFDTSLVTVSRMLSGRSPAVGGRDHSSHRLVALGLSERRAVFVLWFLAVLGGGVGLVLRRASDGLSVLFGGLFLLGVCLFAARLARIRVYEDAPPSTIAGAITPLAGEFLYKRRIAEVLLDFCLIAGAYYWAYRLRYENPEEFLANSERFYQSLPIILAAQLLAFFVVGVYRGVWRHFGLMDSVTIATGIALGIGGAQIALWGLYDQAAQSRSVLVIYVVLLGGMVIASRASFRLMDEFILRGRRTGHRAVIYGASENAGVVLRQLKDGGGNGPRLLGFVDDDPLLARSSVHGYPVLGGYDTLRRMVSGGEVDTVVVTSAAGAQHLDALQVLCESQAVALLRLRVTLEALPAPAPPTGK